MIARLRAAQVRISLAESIDAMRAIAAAGLGREPLREALRTSLIKDARDDPAFDDVFALCFGAQRAAGQRKRENRRAGVSGLGQGGGAGESRAKAEPPRRESGKSASSPPRQMRERPTASAAKDSASQSTAHSEAERNRPARDHESAKPEGPGEAHGATADRSGRTHGGSLDQIPFANYTVLEYEAARDSLGVVARRLRVRLGRRIARARRGRVDFRRTIRAAIQHGGAPMELRFRARRPRHIELVVMADISGSMRYASELTLALMAGARDFFHRMRMFVFIDRPAVAAFEQNHLTMTPTLDLYARSDFGRVLRELQENHRALFNRATVLVIMGDARNNRRPPRADRLKEIARRCRAVIWLNPEPLARWNTGDSAIESYRRVVDRLLPADNLAQLERGLARIW